MVSLIVILLFISFNIGNHSKTTVDSAIQYVMYLMYSELW